VRAKAIHGGLPGDLGLHYGLIRCLPERLVKKTNGGDEVKKRVSTEDSNPSHPAHQLLQPRRSSCSFPVAAVAVGAGASMASMIEQKLAGAKGCEEEIWSAVSHCC